MFSIIIPVYNRPDEVRELLESLTKQVEKDFEVVIIEDGSSDTCLNEVKAYQHQLEIRYEEVENGGPARARNIGAQIAHGDFLIILDSDVVLPPGYTQAVLKGIKEMQCDVFGGPDAAATDFSPTQKGINYAMTSFLTTGGIRGGKSKMRMDKFFPRSFNLGCRRAVFNSIGGFSEDMRFGEDIDFSIRLYKHGYKIVLLPEAFVFHKRRVDLRKFFKQVYNSGIARIHLEARHSGTTKLVHLLPSVFTIGLLALILIAPFCPWSLLPIGLYVLALLSDSLLKNRSLLVALISVPAAFVQLLGYGSGYLIAWWRCHVLKHPEFSAFNRSFYN